MTLTIHWWVIPLVLFALGFIIPPIWPGLKMRGDYDMITPLVCAAIFIFFTVISIAVCVGYWIAQ